MRVVGVAFVVELQRDVLRLGRGADRVDGGLARADARSIGCTFSRSLPVVMRETSSRSSIELRLRLGVALDHLQAVARLARSSFSIAEQLRPAEDRVERRAQLVAERGEELVLDAVGLALLGEERVLDGDRRHLRELDEDRPRRRW